MISEGALLGKLREFAMTKRGQDLMGQRVAYYAEGGNGGKTALGKKVRTEADVEVASARMASLARAAAIDAGLPQSLIEKHFEGMYHTKPYKLSNGGYRVDIYLSGDLHRDSLENDATSFDGIDNIVALFNNGYHARNYAYGWWNGHSPTGDAVGRSLTGGEDHAWIRSRKEREPMRFMQQAVADFNGNYGADYDAVASVGSDYKG